MAPQGTTKISDAFEKRLAAEFGSLQDFKKKVLLRFDANVQHNFYPIQVYRFCNWQLWQWLDLVG
jgi:hypothetical protein